MPRAKKKPVASSKPPPAPPRNMSNYPVPYWGPSSYTQQWTPQPPPSGSMPHNLHINPDPPAVPHQFQNLESFYANAHLPGLGGVGATGTFPPPPFAFPGGFPPTAGPPQFPNLGYPMAPLASAPSHFQPQNQVLRNDSVDPTRSNAPDSQPMPTIESRQDLDREEGELTDIETPVTTEQQLDTHSKAQSFRSNNSSAQNFALSGNGGDRFAQSKQIRPAVLNGLSKSDRQPAHPESSSSGLEEGEASPASRASSRDSGSPYNPPMPADSSSSSPPKSAPEASHSPNEAASVIDPHMPSSTNLQTSLGFGLSLPQLRVQAQGALLSLAPHSIRYKELVGEGINPAVLRQLYEEVGIKVPTTPPVDTDDRANTSIVVLPEVDLSVYQGEPKRPTQQLVPQPDSAQKPSSIEPSPTPSQPTQANSAKPLERKEVIARMLAAKAAKKSPASVQPQVDAAQAPLPSQTARATNEQSTATTPSQDSSSNEKELRTKEKSKAQTELARQRIEQLKKQGLMRNLGKPQADSQISDKEQGVSIQELPQLQIPATIKHPLPERPPLPESASHDQIPGLYMTGQASTKENGAHVTSTHDVALEPVPQPRSTQRKRPRASDFDDDPIPVHKKPLHNGTNHLPLERLVIDISDDEFYADDDDEDVDMHVDRTSTDSPRAAGGPAAEELPRVYQVPLESLPHRPTTSQSLGFSTSTTPNNVRNSEQEDLRKKDLEIQAMHRKIAELEQRKKAKLASRTQSPRASNLSPPEPVMPASSAMPVDNDKNIEDLLAPMEVDGLRKMKAKILRMQEIEAGVPSLDAEIQKAEMKLLEAKREEEKLASELAKGKEGLHQLMQELNAIRLDVSGLSLDHVNAALANMEARKNLPVEVVQAAGYEDKALDVDLPAVKHIPEVDVQAQQDIPREQATPTPTVLNPPSAEPQSVAPITVEDTPIMDAPIEEPSDTSMSEDSSSSMDESSDDSSSDSDSSDEEVSSAQDPGTNSVASGNAVTAPDAESTNGVESYEVADELPRSQPSDPLAQENVSSDAGEIPTQASESRASRESSVSEAYEPPEPEESASAFDSSYSPAPSPDFTSPTINFDASGSSKDQSQEAGEPLTAKIQEQENQRPSQYYYDIDPLDNARHPEHSQRKFSPYTSPLKLFKAYRYHPNYHDNVPGGYRSLTYSHNIDPLKHLCPFETSGGVCNDRSCEYQHFRDMALSDDKILVQLGSLREGKTPEECDKYVAGLKETINDMRRDKVKDMSTVATEIAAYRRRFLQDPTRVLAL